MNPIFIKIGNFSIYWYSFILFVAFLLGCFFVIKEAKKRKISEVFITDFTFYTIPICLIGARLYYVIFNLDYYMVNPFSIFRVWEGGLAIHGGIMAGLIFLIYYTKKKNVNTLKLIDIVVISLIFGQILGRWGNFMNSEAYGPATTLNFLNSIHIPQFIIDGMKIDGIYYHPTFLYESLWNIIGLFIMIIIRKTKHNKVGYLSSIYLIWYGIGRFLIEGLRTDSLMLLNIKVAQLVSILMIIIGLILIIYSKKRNEKYE